MKNLPLDYGIGSGLSNPVTFRKPLVLMVLVLACARLFAVDFVAEGEKQMALNNPEKAATYLEAALAQGSPTDKLFLDLGLTYTKLTRVEDAQKAFQAGAELGGDLKATLLLDLGISQARAQNYSGADETFSALLSEHPDHAAATLNRANNRVQLKQYGASVADYKAYQSLVPENPQKDKIDQLISLLENASMEQQALELASQTRAAREAEAKKAEEAKTAAAAAEAAQKAEAARQEEAQAAAAEQAKQDEILARIRDTLAGASADSKSLSTGPAGVKSDEGDFALEP